MGHNVTVGCFLISQIFCVCDLQHIAKWFFLSQFLQIFPFAWQLSNLWYLLLILLRDVFAAFCGYFFHPECFVVSFLSPVTASIELSCISSICVLTCSLPRTISTAFSKLRSSLSWSFSYNSLLFSPTTKRSLIWLFFKGKSQFSACSYNPQTNFSIRSPSLCVLRVKF